MKLTLSSPKRFKPETVSRTVVSRSLLERWVADNNGRILFSGEDVFIEFRSIAHNISFRLKGTPAVRKTASAFIVATFLDFDCVLFSPLWTAAYAPVSYRENINGQVIDRKSRDWRLTGAVVDAQAKIAFSSLTSLLTVA